MAATDPQLQPIDKGSIHNVAISANTDMFSSDIKPTKPPCVFRIMIATNGGAKLEADITRAGSQVTVNFNAESNMTANAFHIFDLLMGAGDDVNFQLNSSVTVHVMRIFEIPTAIGGFAV